MFQQHHREYLKLTQERRFSSTSAQLSIKPAEVSKSNGLLKNTMFLSGWEGLSYEFLITDFEYQPLAKHRLHFAPNKAPQPLEFGGTQITVLASPRLSQPVRTDFFAREDQRCTVHTNPNAVGALSCTDGSVVFSRTFFIDSDLATAKAGLMAPHNVGRADGWILFSFMLSGEVLGLDKYRHPYVQYLSPPFSLGISHGLKQTLVNPGPTRFRFVCFLVQLEIPRRRVRDGEGKEWGYYTVRLAVCWRDQRPRDPQRRWLVFTGRQGPGIITLRGGPVSLFRDLRRIERSIIMDERRRRKRGDGRIVHEMAFQRDLLFGTEQQTFRDELLACDTFYEEEKTLEVVEPSSYGSEFGDEEVNLLRVEKQIMALSEEARVRAGFSIREQFLAICSWIKGRRVYKMSS